VKGTTKLRIQNAKACRIEPAIQIVMTDLGIKKNYDQLDPCQEDVDRVVSLVQSQL
jgi:uncharacterized metal-binding protein